MKRIIMLLMGLLLVQVAAAATGVTVLADRALTVSWRSDDQYATTPTGSFDLKDEGGGLYRGAFYKIGSYWAALTAPQIEGYSFLGWYTLPSNVGYVESTVQDCSVRLTTGFEISSSTYTKSAKTSSMWWGDYILCPKYEPIQFSVSFDGNGATSGSMQDQTGKTIDSSFALTANAFLRTGYSFGGWTNRSGRIFADCDQVTGANFWNSTEKMFDASLYAVWIVGVCTVTFDSNGGSEPVPGSKPVTYGELYGALPTVTRAGHAFAGWWTEKDGGTRVTDTTRAFLTANQTLYAHWSINTYSVGVSVIGNGSATRDPDAARYDYDTSVSLVACPNEGYAFAGWSDGSADANRAITVVSNANYTAIFTARVYTVTFNADPGDCEEKSRKVAFGNYIGDLPTATQFHKRHTGWYTDGGRQISSLDRYEWSVNITLYARYVDAEKYDIAADVRPDPACGTVSGVGQYVEGDPVQLVANPAEGYGFRDWNDGNASSVTNFTVVGGRMLTAVFTANVYTVTFVSAEGSPRRQTKSVTYNATYGIFPPVTAEEDRELEGWYTEAGGTGVRVTPESIVSTASDHELYANWRDVPTYRIVYDGNGGTGPVPVEQKAYCGVETNLLPNAYSLIGHVFLGWSTNAMAKAADYANCASVKDLVGQNEVCTLYAIWRPLTLAEAMHATGDLEWNSVTPSGQSVDSTWDPVVDVSAGFEQSGSCVRESAGAMPNAVQLLTALLPSDGRLGFRFKFTDGNDKSRLYFSIDTKSNETTNVRSPIYAAPGPDGWSMFATNVMEEAGKWIHIKFYSPSGSCDIDQMTWTPKGSEPKYVDVDSEVTEFSMADGKLIFVFDATNDETSAYHLLGTNDLVAPMPWPMVYEIGKLSGSFTFEIPIKEDEPKMFYRIRALK